MIEQQLKESHDPYPSGPNYQYNPKSVQLHDESNVVRASGKRVVEIDLDLVEKIDDGSKTKLGHML